MSDEIRKNFASDNIAPACPEVLDALLRANRGPAPAYGSDELTGELERRFAILFERGLISFPVATGTAANSLALSALVPPYGAVLCDQSAHIANDEGGAPEFFTHGAKLIPIPSPDGRMKPDALRAAIELNRLGGLQSPPARALSLTQSTEWGTLYTLDDLRELTTIAHDGGMTVHMDGARFANAVAALGCTAAQASWEVGIDVLTFGGTKNGAIAAEAVLFFTPSLAEDFLRRVKRSGHLWSKQRFMSAQLLALLENDLWLDHARQANAMAERLAHGLHRYTAATLPYETQANEVFVVLPKAVTQALEDAGYRFYRWPTPPGVTGDLIRLVTDFTTTTHDIDALLAAL
ncbi:threonine aldolase family protein [Brytella acorum]|uniref:L-threonine aldolase n=1 Tax=Brytella acorum TaxID=2959299 RepID=A0AA35UPU1_9PROT|nr:low specificity L-threonine aldolase [Brytella acorum]MDF3624958.1 low specificity L-threonine aldolase [Brytella acorum]CAI9121441.1 low specificity L-threonine aldolase [Brytella acorum]